MKLKMESDGDLDGSAASAQLLQQVREPYLLVRLGTTPCYSQAVPHPSTDHAILPTSDQIEHIHYSGLNCNRTVPHGYRGMKIKISTIS